MQIKGYRKQGRTTLTLYFKDELEEYAIKKHGREKYDIIIAKRLRKQENKIAKIEKKRLDELRRTAYLRQQEEKCHDDKNEIERKEIIKKAKADALASSENAFGPEVNAITEIERCEETKNKLEQELKDIYDEIKDTETSLIKKKQDEIKLKRKYETSVEKLIAAEETWEVLKKSKETKVESCSSSSSSSSSSTSSL